MTSLQPVGIRAAAESELKMAELGNRAKIVVTTQIEVVQRNQFTATMNSFVNNLGERAPYKLLRENVENSRN